MLGAEDRGDPLVVDAGFVEGLIDALPVERLGQDVVDGRGGRRPRGVAGREGALLLLGRIKPGLDETLEALPLAEGKQPNLGLRELPEEALLAKLLPPGLASLDPLSVLV
jgi:hypothetical protein